MDQFDLMFLDEMRDFFGLPENTKAKNFTQLSDIGILSKYEMLFDEPVWKRSEVEKAVWGAVKKMYKLQKALAEQE